MRHRSLFVSGRIESRARTRRSSPGVAFFVFFAVLAGIFGSCRTAPTVRTVPLPPTAAATAAPGDSAAVSPIAPPVIRVGILVGVPRASVAAPSGVLVRAVGDVSAEPKRFARATFLPRAAGSAPPARFRVQLASLREESAGREIADRVAAAGIKFPTDVRWSEETKTYQVRSGSWATREEAMTELACFRPLGFPRPWVVEEAQAAVDNGRVEVAETSEAMGPATIVPAKADEILSVDGSEYRGLIEVRPDENGGITVVNVINLEDYLRGVVPNELSPVVYPQIEALKAQAVAARTYAIRNRGQYQARGYDICATQACQVYRGKSTEHPLSDQAVEETRSQIAATEDGVAINALYTSTCGGHTEDGENMFEGQGASYLKGVACVPEKTLWATLHTSRTPRRLGQAEGLSRDVALLIALDVVDAEVYSPTALKANAGDEELRGWTSRLVSAVHRRGCAGTSKSVARRGAFFRHVVDSVCWTDRAKRLLAPQDPEYLLQLDDRTALTDPDERLSAALLLQEGVLSPFEDNTLHPERTITRGDAVHLLAGVAMRVGVPSVHAGVFKQYDGDRLALGENDATSSFSLQRNLWLFRALDGTHLGTTELSLTVGDKVNVVAKDDQVVFLEAEQSRLGAAADKTSRYYRWEVRLTPDEIAKGIERFGSVGRVQDIVPKRNGVSGRVVELSVVGSSGELPLRGLKIRTALNLRENLFVVDRERNAAGTVTHFIFTGKGWGHGVGLCQVGAWGMAQAGATYEEILQHYYTGIILKRLPESVRQAAATR